ncbi:MULTISPECIES: PAQR family membrane homeostasis protein TrhA [Aerococcus]|uniref:PAQR family membrane homeostasis protein TrhA n=1 Tax=Aerococcus TaxID=1375 RepID=UPI000DCC396D|nr:hemolysin III family protein [Aerococcus urinae]MDK7302464.1 hemolysin III family protein [Aerococcus urinae]RAV70277.1 hemolysin III [Aerococcus urinae]RAW04489.1 hemolysin III [Aerococcus urinae]
MEKQQNLLFSNPQILNSRSYQVTSQIFSAISHGIGLLLALIGTGLLISKAFQFQELNRLMAYTIYGLSMINLYFFSTMYHALYFTKVAPIFRFFDHCSIYFLIAGSYSPFCLIALNNSLGWLIFFIEWLIVALGLYCEIYKQHWLKKYSTYIYLSMGWLAVFIVYPIIQSVSLAGLLWLLAGGLFYSLGTSFYRFDHKYVYFHTIWHLFVLLGTACQFISIYFYV